LPQNRYLVYTVLKMGWAKDARTELLRVFREEPGRFSPGWIEAIASMRDPSTYEELKQYLIHGQFRGHTYNALKQIPDIGDLKDAVEKAWPIAKNGNEYEARDMAEIAASYGIEDAVAFQKKSKKETPTPAAKTNEDQAICEFTHYSLAGSKLNTEQAAELEKKVAANGEDIESRAKLLGYYSRPRLTKEDARRAAQVHILWLINNRPADYLAGTPYTCIFKQLDEPRYVEAANAWEGQLKKHPDDMKIIENAANYFLLSDIERAEELLRHAMELEPKNAKWAEQLGKLYQLKAMKQKDGEAKQSFGSAFELQEKALRDKQGQERFYQLPEVAMFAYRAGDLAKAQQYAQELLDMVVSFNDWNTGNAVFTGNSVLGLVALEKNDVNSAKKYLLAAGTTKGSPSLGSFGPNMVLAQKLLAKGETGTVLQYLDEIAKFWKMGQDRIVQWKQDIRAGKTVRFGNEWY
jgi:hypothetical protein